MEAVPVRAQKRAHVAAIGRRLRRCPGGRRGPATPPRNPQEKPSTAREASPLSPEAVTSPSRRRSRRRMISVSVVNARSQVSSSSPLTWKKKGPVSLRPSRKSPPPWVASKEGFRWYRWTSAVKEPSIRIRSAGRTVKARLSYRSRVRSPAGAAGRRKRLSCHSDEGVQGSRGFGARAFPHFRKKPPPPVPALKAGKKRAN